MQLTRLSLIVQVCGIHYLQDINDRGKITKTLPTTTRPIKGDPGKPWILDSKRMILENHQLLCYVEVTILSTKEVSFSNLKFKGSE